MGKRRERGQGLFKDEILDRLADTANVAQFVSFSPGADPKLRFLRLDGWGAGQLRPSPERAIQELFQRSVERKVNIRSFQPDAPRGRSFPEAIDSPVQAARIVRELASSGLYSIVNESVNKADGGVSGAIMGDVIEFGPWDTPRILDDAAARVVSIERERGIEMLRIVYQVDPELDYPRNERVEFSITMMPRGIGRRRTIVWERSPGFDVCASERIAWPNDFSRLVGDKVFGLIVGHILGAPVPRTTVINRTIPPFVFGRSTGTSAYWLRTAPATPRLGKFTTTFGWRDPFALLSAEDGTGMEIPSVVSQEGVNAIYSGASASLEGEEIAIEGVAGQGDSYMGGASEPIPLPGIVVESVLDLHRSLARRLGSVKCEWVFDGAKAWLVQLRQTGTGAGGDVIFPGCPRSWREFDPSPFPETQSRIAALEAVIRECRHSRSGILLKSHSKLGHLAETLCANRIPSRLT